MTVEITRYRLRHRTRPIDVLVAGRGRPLVLLHGWGLSGRAYREAMIALAERGWMVAAPWLAVTEGWSIQRVAEIAAEAMAGVDCAPAPVIGHSFGGAIGAQLASDHPDFVRALVAVNSPLVSLGHGRIGRIMLPGPHYRIVGHGSAAAALFRSAATSGGVGSLFRSARWFLGTTQESLLRSVVAANIPRRVIWAENDTLLPLEVGKRAAEILACDLQLVSAGDGWPGPRPPDHDWPMRHPEHFAHTIDTTIASLLADHGTRKRARRRSEQQP